MQNLYRLVIVCVVVFLYKETYAISPPKKVEQYGEWYQLITTGLVKRTYTSDTIYAEYLKNDFSPQKLNIIQKKAVLKVWDIKGNISFITKVITKTDTLYEAETIFDVKQDSAAKIAWNYGYKEKSIKELVKKLKAHPKSLGFHLYSKKQIEAVSKLKSVEKMKDQDFLNYISLQHKKHKENKEESDTFFSGYGRRTLSYQIKVRTLIELGFTPLEESIVLSNVVREFYKKDSIKKQVRQIRSTK